VIMHVLWYWNTCTSWKCMIKVKPLLTVLYWKSAAYRKIYTFNLQSYRCAITFLTRPTTINTIKE